MLLRLLSSAVLSSSLHCVIIYSIAPYTHRGSSRGRRGRHSNNHGDRHNDDSNRFDAWAGHAKLVHTRPPEERGSDGVAEAGRFEMDDGWAWLEPEHASASTHRPRRRERSSMPRTASTCERPPFITPSLPRGAGHQQQSKARRLRGLPRSCVTLILQDGSWNGRS